MKPCATQQRQHRESRSRIAHELNLHRTGPYCLLIATMGIWHGKQLLGQRDVTPVELTGSNGSELKFSKETIDAIIAEAKKSN